MENFTCFHIEMGKMGITFHKIQIEHTFAFADCFFVFMRKTADYSCKNEQVFHKLFSKCGKLSFSHPANVENSDIFVDTDREPQIYETHKKNEVDFIIKYIYNRPCVFSNVQTFSFCVVIE